MERRRRSNTFTHCELHSKRRNLQPLFCAVIIFVSLILGFCTSSAIASPTMSFSLSETFPRFPSFTSFTQSIIEKRSAKQMKTYSGKRVSNDSLIMIYHHDSTVAVAELGPGKLLLGCELIEIYTKPEGTALLDELSKLNKPLEITFPEMLKLMKKCEQIDKVNEKSKKRSRGEIVKEQTTNLQGSLFPKSPLSLLNGIIPGTKWCGTGDIADSYSDLGDESTMDRCCREHDLCPIKIRAYQNKYDLINESLYTKSHCVCDDMLFGCLKRTNTSASQLMGSIYFNLVQVPCLKSTKDGSFSYRQAREGF